MTKMQCKDINDATVLRHLVTHGGIGCTVWRDENGAPYNERSAIIAMPTQTPEKLARAKMLMLQRRGFINGCGCGCRGDWDITALGRQWLQNHETGTK